MDVAIKTQTEKSPDKANMDAKATMNGGAINTKEDPIGNRSPSRILSIAIKTNLKKEKKNTHTHTRNFVSTQNQRSRYETYRSEGGNSIRKRKRKEFK